MFGYLLVGGVGALVTFLTAFAVRRIAPRIGAIALPGPRSVHTYPTPSLGGAAMFVGFCAALATASQVDQFHEMFDSSSEPLGLLLAAGVMFLVGAVDDVREVSPPAKLAGQILSGSILSLLGVTMLYFRVPFASYDYVVLSPDLATFVTVLTVVVLANAMNLIDGLDGLATGIVIIAGAALFLYSDRLLKAGLLDGSNIAPLVAVIAVSICVGFLPHNFSPARLFMGDAGSMFLGLLLAAIVITMGGRTADQFSGQTYFFFAPLLIPVVILAVPLIDTGFSFAAPSRPTEVVPHRRPRAPPSPVDAPRARAAPLGDDPVAVDRARLRGRADPDVHEPRQRARPDRAGRARAPPLHVLPPGHPPQGRRRRGWRRELRRRLGRRRRRRPDLDDHRRLRDGTG